ncbi:NAD(P)-binding protein [Dichomitus squalens LYAD-421 SS1]|uniref:NAD(P)-binding protein n=1 Tax=Dichomitus squalens (strain LYAD-421) TaxID=732165 RepID=R7SKW5_DICSQ|nr:NAD(P)-binding protein [Dichomitus squalens LYAD-421 SS1]EJF56380.1 NAD(P)-binding protein [Dichomitus squalens LYAD-421 SS1]
MPTIAAPEKILVTGANGYLGVWVSKLLLERGYLVRGVVRTKEKGNAFVKIFEEKLPTHVKNIEYVLVPDISAEHAFDDAVKGVTGIVHIASPLTNLVQDVDFLIRPAVEGTLGVLKSALAHGTDLKRVVITSSVRAVVQAEARTYTEDNWAEDAVKIVEEKKNEANGMYIYGASKVLAEKAAWNFYEKHKSEIVWDIVTIPLAWVIGPTVEDPPSLENIPSTAGLFYLMLVSNPMWDAMNASGINYVDPRDAAEAHIKALEVEAAGGERIIVSSHWCTWQDWRNKAAEYGYFPKLDKGDPKRGADLPRRICSNEKAKHILGIQFRVLPDTLKDTLDYYKTRGWLAEYEA